MTTTKIALVQTNAVRDPAENFPVVAALVRRAVEGGARFVLTPENAVMMEPRRELAIQKSPTESAHPAVAFFSDLARETGTMLLAGSIAVAVEGGKLANRSILFDEAGQIAARYDKIHLFDVDLPNGEQYRESNTYAPGDRAVVVPTAFGTLGLTICYDVRFAYLYRTLAQAGAEILTVPAAFTRVTGKAHWHTLLTARAIETGCYVLAPAQTGEHAEGRMTFGHSLIVSPWGEIMADGGEEVGVVWADIDLEKMREARSRVPALRHDRPFRLDAAAVEGGAR